MSTETYSLSENGDTKTDVCTPEYIPYKTRAEAQWHMLKLHLWFMVSTVLNAALLGTTIWLFMDFSDFGHIFAGVLCILLLVASYTAESCFFVSLFPTNNNDKPMLLYGASDEAKLTFQCSLVRLTVFCWFSGLELCVVAHSLDILKETTEDYVYMWICIQVIIQCFVLAPFLTGMSGIQAIHTSESIEEEQETSSSSSSSKIPLWIYLSTIICTFFCFGALVYGLAELATYVDVVERVIWAHLLYANGVVLGVFLVAYYYIVCFSLYHDIKMSWLQSELPSKRVLFLLFAWSGIHLSLALTCSIYGWMNIERLTDNSLYAVMFWCGLLHVITHILTLYVHVHQYFMMKK